MFGSALAAFCKSVRLTDGGPDNIRMTEKVSMRRLTKMSTNLIVAIIDSGIHEFKSVDEIIWLETILFELDSQNIIFWADMDEAKAPSQRMIDQRD